MTWSERNATAASIVGCWLGTSIVVSVVIILLGPLGHGGPSAPGAPGAPAVPGSPPSPAGPGEPSQPITHKTTASLIILRVYRARRPGGGFVLDHVIDPLRVIPFVPYPKIVDRIAAWNADDAERRALDKERWVASEKIHGANLCICTDGTEIAVAKRRALLDVNDRFFDYKRAIAPLVPPARAVLRQTGD